MNIDFVSDHFEITGPFSELEALRAIPLRTWCADKQRWIAPRTQANIEYLQKWSSGASPRAKSVFSTIPVPSIPDLPPDFRFKTQPYPHQLEALRRGLGQRAFALAMEPGTGKSKVLIDDVVATKMPQAAIVCPNSITTNWLDEIDIHSSAENDVHIYDPLKKKQAGTWISRFTSAKAGVKWFIIAAESLSSGDGWKYLEAFLQARPTALLVDESTRFKTPKASRTKKLIDLAPLAARTRLASGTMLTRGLQDAWSQFEILDPQILNMSYYPFRNHFCIMGGFKSKVIVANKNERDFIDLTAPYIYMATKAECLDLPKKVYQVRHVKPSPEQERLYMELATKGLAESADGCTSYTNALVRDLRLQQIAGGFLSVSPDLAPPPNMDISDFLAALEDGTVPAVGEGAEPDVLRPVAGANAKLEELKAILDDCGSKVIIWCRFRPEIAAVAQTLAAEHGRASVVEFHGGIDSGNRAVNRRRFQDDPKCRFFVGQVNTGGIGITLTAADTAIYFSNSFSLEDRIQSEDRCHRIGQKAKSVTYIDLVMGPSTWIDAKVLQALREKRDYTSAVMDEIHQATKKFGGKK